jgi:hypothetical protein
MVQSDADTSFYTSAMSHSATEILSKFIALAPSLPLHAKANMPGKILLFEVFKLFTSSPEAMGYLIIVLSSLGALLLYGICKRLFHNRKMAFYAFTLYILVPCKLFFFPILNTVTPVFMLLCFYFFAIYLENKKLWVAWLLGLSGYILILFEPSPLITGFVFIGILIYALKEKRLSKKDIYRLLINTFLAFGVAYIIFYALFSFNLFGALLYILRGAGDFNLIQGRGYQIWIIENSKEFFYGAGIPVLVIFIYMTANVFVQTRTLKDLAQWSLENIFIISLLVTYVVLLFLGINRGEVTRLWIYLAVLFQVPASIFIAKINKSGALFFLVAATLAIQAMITLHRVGFVIP